MGTDKEDKERAILTKFRRESDERKFSYRKKILLAKIWIKILIQAEEYEMAGALAREKFDISTKMIAEKRSSRTLIQKIKYYWIKLKRRKVKKIKKGPR